jgi:hypothetical protein
MLLQHSEFSQVHETTNGTLYSVLDMKTALGKLETIYPNNDEDHDAFLPIYELTRFDLLVYCALDAAHRLLLGVTTIPPKGFSKLVEAVVSTPSPVLRFKTLTLVCTLQSLADSLLRDDTLGVKSLDESELASILGLRTSTSRHLSGAKLNGVTSQGLRSLHEPVKRRFKEDTKFIQQISLPIDSEIDTAHLAILRLEDLLTRREMNLAQRVQEYFRINGLDPLLCPISERPMTEAIFLRCGKTINQAALEELIAGNIPELHCCCDEIHIDIAHKLHDCPLISDLAIRHLRRALDISDVVKYGDLPTLRVAFSEVKDEDKVKLLHISIATKNLSIVTFLLDAGVDVNIADNDRTPLMLAAGLGSTDLVVALLHYGASPDHRDSKGVCALTCAASKSHRAVVEIIFKKSAKVTVESALSPETSLAAENRGQCAIALHDLWLGFKESDHRDSILYLQRAMELDPENHLYAEEMQAYLDDQESRESDRVYVSQMGPFLFLR